MTFSQLLFWEHGTLLQPQHFQILSGQMGMKAALLSGALCPHLWGVRKFTVREEALELMRFELADLDLILPGGERLLLNVNACVTPRAFAEYWPEQDVPLDVFLGLEPFSEGRANVTEVESLTLIPPDAARFIALNDPEQVPDFHSKGPQADLRFMMYNARLVFGTETELLEHLEIVPLARLERDGAHIRLSPSKIPPCLDLFASPLLTEIMRGVHNTVTARAKRLEEAKILPSSLDAGAAQAVPTGQSLTLYMMLGVLCRFAPVLEHLCEAPSLHPWQAYGALRSLVGELSAFTAELSPLGEDAAGERVLPAYDHKDPVPCFESARAIISRVVDSFTAGPSHSFLMEYRQGRFVCSLPPQVCGNAFRFWLLVRAGTGMEHLAEHISRRGKFAPADRINDLVARSLSGVRLPIVNQPPPGLPRRNDTLYFAPDQTDPLWENLMANGEAALFVPELPENTLIHLALVHR